MSIQDFLAWAQATFIFPSDSKFQSYCRISEYKLQEKPYLLCFSLFLIANVLALVVILVYCKGYRTIAEKHFGRTILIPMDG